MFNEICINEEMLPKYAYIYIYIYIDRQTDRLPKKCVHTSAKEESG